MCSTVEHFTDIMDANYDYEAQRRLPQSSKSFFTYIRQLPSILKTTIEDKPTTYNNSMCCGNHEVSMYELSDVKVSK